MSTNKYQGHERNPSHDAHQTAFDRLSVAPAARGILNHVHIGDEDDIGVTAA